MNQKNGVLVGGSVVDFITIVITPENGVLVGGLAEIDVIYNPTTAMVS